MCIIANRYFLSWLMLALVAASLVLSSMSVARENLYENNTEDNAEYKGNDVIILSTQQRIELGSRVWYAEDPLLTLSIEDLKNIQWTRSDVSIPNMGFTKSAYWFSFQLFNQSNKEHNYRLEIPYPLLDTIELYQLEKTGEYSVTRTGDSLPFSERNHFHHYPVFDIALSPQQNTQFYIRIQSQDTLQVPLVLWEEKRYQRHVYDDQYVFGIYYGMMFVMIIYNFFLFITLRDLPAGYYVAFLMCFVTVQMSLNGFFQVYIIPENPELTKWVRPLVLGLGVGALIAFNRHSFKLNIYAPKFDRFLQKLTWIAYLSCFSFLFVSFTVSIIFSMLLTIVNAIIMIIACGIGIKNNIRAAKYLALAYASFVIMGCLTVARAYGLAPVNFFTEYGMQVGSVMVVVLLALGLADRVTQEKQLKHEAEKRALENETIAQRERENSLNVRLKAKEEQHKVEQQALQAQAETKAKSDFLATMSHEIRTPMNGVIGIAELMSETNLDKQQEEFLSIIKSSGQSLLAIINDILDFSKIEAGEMELESTDFNLKQLIADIQGMFIVSVRLKESITFNVDFDEHVSEFINGDPTRIRQVIINFLSNAFKFTESGTVTLKVEPGLQEHIKFSVADTGIGLSKSVQTKIFQAYSQAEASTTRDYGGTGLGLTICKNLAKLMDGEIGVDSEKNVGSTFWFTAKLQSVKAINTSKTEDNISLERLRGKSILVAEDNPVNQLVITKMLTKLGISVVVAENGAMALEQYKQMHYDMILMDCEMPIMNGYDAAKAIRAHESELALTATPIVALTAHVMQEQKELCLAAGMSSHLAKPLILNELKTVLLTHILR